MDRSIYRLLFNRFISLIFLLELSLIPDALHSQVPKLSSNPVAASTIFIDFDGHEVSGTAWNWNGPIVAEAAQLSSDAITEIFQRVAEDYRVFNINVTTDSAAYENAPFYKRIRVIVTPTSQWYDPAVAGVSYVGSFNWGNNTPAWAFNNLLSNQPKYIAEVVSHESGHTLGLQHQSTYNGNCELINEYSEGQGTGETSWAPIMGLGYYRNLTTWNNGPSTVACGIWQNDLQIIAFGPNDIGLRDDDHGDNLSNATPVLLKGTSVNINGMINVQGDRDVFRLPVAVTSPVRLSAIPLHVGSANAGANVDLKLILLHQNGDTLRVDNPEWSLDASLDTTLNPGIYFLVVEGTSNENLPAYGSMGLYNLTGDAGAILPVRKFKLTGKRINGTHELTWELISDEKTGDIKIETSHDGIQFSALTTVSSASKIFISKASGKITYYRLFVTSMSGISSYSNIVSIQKEERQEWILHNNIIQDKIMLTGTIEATYEVIGTNGRILLKGRLSKGSNYVYLPSIPPGLLFLKLLTNNKVVTYKIIKS